MTYQKKIGNKGEEIAADHLQDKGYQLLDYNFTTRFGELDLVALDSGSIVFIEVKTRTSVSYGMPEASITSAKIEKIQNAGLLWLQAHPDAPDDWRIDAIAILIDDQDNILDIQHFINI
jgi:putative endonuclease